MRLLKKFKASLDDAYSQCEQGLISNAEFLAWIKENIEKEAVIEKMYLESVVRAERGNLELLKNRF